MRSKPSPELINRWDLHCSHLRIVKALRNDLMVVNRSWVMYPSPFSRMFDICFSHAGSTARSVGKKTHLYHPSTSPSPHSPHYLAALTGKRVRRMMRRMFILTFSSSNSSTPKDAPLPSTAHFPSPLLNSSVFMPRLLFIHWRLGDPY